ncbi:MAG: VOC family protein [Rubricoccaceae bacterium]
MPARLGHLRLDVADLARAVAFYTEALGLRVHERATDDESHYAFLEDGGGAHHCLVLRQARDASGTPLPEPTRLDHFAFEVADEADLLAFVKRLEQMGVETDLQEAGIAWQCYFRDPEGNRLELYCDRRQAEGGRPLWHGIQENLTRAALERGVA